jgi:predicted flap endonuclease-1-like 5' DNA nuclease
MIWLVLEIWILLILAIGLGVVLGWFIATKLGTLLRPRRRMSEVLLLPDVRSDREEADPMSTGSAPPETASDEIRRAPQGDDGEALRLRLRASYADARIRVLEDMLRGQVSKASARSSPPAGRDLNAPPSRHPNLCRMGPRPEGPDLLQRLPGLGPSIETRLHQLGIFHFDQIAGMSPGEAEWLDAQLGGAGRVRFENWVQEAGRLSRETARRA